MTAHLSSQDEQSTHTTSVVEGEPQAAIPSAPQAIVLPGQPEPEGEEPFYFEDEQPDLVDTPFVAPFQCSHAMPTVSAQAQPFGPITPAVARPAPA